MNAHTTIAPGIGHNGGPAITAETIKPQPGPQTTFLSSPADIAIYGGGAGGGKTWGLLMEPLRHVSNPGFGAVFFRRSTVQIRNEGGLWDESATLYPQLGADPKEHELWWKFPGGAAVSFAHLEHDKTRFNYQGAQIPLICVAQGTQVLTADGTYRPIEKLAVGDLVMTIEGARKITRTFAPRQAECVRAIVSETDGTVIGEQVHPSDHPVLTPQGWVSYEDVRAASPVSSATESHGSRKSSSPASKRCQSNRPILDSLLQDHPQHDGRPQSSLDHSGCSGFSACSAGVDTDSAAFDDGCQDGQQLARLSVPVVLHGPDPREEASRGHLRRRGASCAHVDPSIPDSSDHYSFYRDRDDGRSLCQPEGGPTCPPSPDDAGAPCHPCCIRDDLERAQSHSQMHLFEYDHPYTMERRSASEAVHVGSCEFMPIGEATVYDIAVEEVNHYVTSSKLINKNCFDELTHFTAVQFWYMVSRNRSMCGVRPYIRATCNPDADSWVADLIAWWIDQDTGLPIPERSGVVRWFVRVGEDLRWGDSPEELACYLMPDGTPIPPKSLTFIPAKLTDNKALMDADPGYMASLLALPLVERERLLGGNWKIRPAAGLYFQRAWCRVVDTIPAGTVFGVGYDLAATPPSPENPNPDATSRTKIGRTPDGRYIVVHNNTVQTTPAGVETFISNNASQDGKQVTISLPQDPGQAGKSQVKALTLMLSGYTVRSSTETGDKVTRFGPFSAQAEAGNVDVLRGEWNDPWFSELEAFPSAKHDDRVDSTSRAFEVVALQKRRHSTALLVG